MSGSANSVPAGFCPFASVVHTHLLLFLVGQTSADTGIHPESDEEFRRWQTELGHTIGGAVVNPDAKSPLMRKRINEPYMGYAQPRHCACVRLRVSCCVGPDTCRNRWFDFLRWLDTCSDPNCARYHHYEVRTSPPVPPM
jgi:hypothetical protein